MSSRRRRLRTNSQPQMATPPPGVRLSEDASERQDWNIADAPRHHERAARPRSRPRQRSETRQPEVGIAVDRTKGPSFTPHWNTDPISAGTPSLPRREDLRGVRNHLSRKPKEAQAEQVLLPSMCSVCAKRRQNQASRIVPQVAAAFVRAYMEAIGYGKVFDPEGRVVE